MNARARNLLIVAAMAAAALIVVALFAPRLAAAGWLLAFTYIAAFPLGSLALLMIHKLTGGRWGEALEPFLRPLALTTPLLLILFVPVLAASPVLFTWNAGNVAISSSVQLVYLNVPSYAVRSLIALAGWSVLAFLVPSAKGRFAQLLAGLGLVFYGIAISFMALEWLLTAEPVFFSTSFGASVAFTQLLAALALAAVAGPREWEFPDLGALMLVVTLGLTYTDFMAVLVMWYGDVPSKVSWFVERIVEPWRALAIAAFIVTAFVPVALLMFARVRAHRTALRAVGTSSLVGLAIYQTWLLAPAFGVVTIGTALIALLAMAALTAAAIAGGWAERLAPRGRTAHG